MSIIETFRFGESIWRAIEAVANGSMAPLRANSPRLGRSRSPTSIALNGRLALARHDPHHLLGRYAIGAERGDERAGGGADIDVELVDGGVYGEQVDRAQGADLIDPAGEPAAAEDEGRLVTPGTPATVDRSGAPDTPRGLRACALARRSLCLALRFQLDNLAHARFILRSRGPVLPPPAPLFFGRSYPWPTGG